MKLTIDSATFCDMWNSNQFQLMSYDKLELSNPEDHFAVAACKHGITVGDVPKRHHQFIFIAFAKRWCNLADLSTNLFFSTINFTSLLPGAIEEAEMVVESGPLG